MVSVLLFVLKVANVVRIYMLESLLVTYGYQMEDSWNNLVTRSWDEAQEKVEITCRYWEAPSVGSFYFRGLSFPATAMSKLATSADKSTMLPTKCGGLDKTWLAYIIGSKPADD